jgi:hypothetical protein
MRRDPNPAGAGRDLSLTRRRGDAEISEEFEDWQAEAPAPQGRGSGSLFWEDDTDGIVGN